MKTRDKSFSHGTLHQSSCACTPQGNGLIEHENRHLIEITYTLLCFTWSDHSLHGFFLLNLSFAFPLASLVAPILFIFLLQNKTSSQLKPWSVSSWATLNFKGAIDAILVTQIDILFLPMLPSLKILPSPLHSVLMFLMSCFFPLFYHIPIYLSI